MSFGSRDYVDLVRPLIEGRKFLLSIGPVAGSTGAAQKLREFGAEEVFILGQGLGAGQLPKEEEARWINVMADAEGLDMMESIREFERRLMNPSPEVVAAIDAFDPEKRAMIRGAIWSDVQEVAGRHVYGRRLPEWSRLEDKVVVDGIWDEVGIERARARVVPAEEKSLKEAARDLDEGKGTVWAGDAREGFNGGAAYVRWIRPGAEVQEAADFFREHCDLVRVMPFLSGIPCSICGVVFPETEVALRPVEMVVFIRPESARFLYAGANTFWDPPAADREAMRETARRLGRHLRKSVGYRGTFVIDGVLTAQGFLPTELNARSGASIGILNTVPDLPLNYVLEAVREGEDLDFHPSELERLVVDSADGNRRGGGWSLVGSPKMEETIQRRLVLGPAGEVRWTEEGEEGNGNVMLGPSSTGGFFKFLADADAVPPGPSLTPVVQSVFAFADRELGTDYGPLIPAEPA